MGEILHMSEQELDRYHVLKKIMDNELKQREGAQMLHLTGRQVRNLLKRLEQFGPTGLISKKRGQSSNRLKPTSIRRRALALMRERYEGFGPTLGQEKLEELHHLKLSVETLRQWMVQDKLWIPKVSRRKDHLPRLRRRCFGELTQGDGSHHHWLGEDQPMINATVLIDDATGILTALQFSPTETLESYFQALEQHLKRYGRPRALYTDRYAIFQPRGEKGFTQMQRALKTLDISLILANSPQAKGRVERVNRTLQDRLIKEMRLRGIKTIEQANLFALDFVEKFNKKFSKKPMSGFDAHRPLEGYDLERILTRFEKRTLSSSGTFNFNNIAYQVQDLSKNRYLKGKVIEIRIINDGRMRAFSGGKEVTVLPLDQIIERPKEMTRKEVLCWESRRHSAPVTHPWKIRCHRKMINKDLHQQARGVI